MRNSTLSVGYQHVRGMHLIVSVNQNVPTCAASGDQQRMPSQSCITPTTANTHHWRIRTMMGCTFPSFSGREVGQLPNLLHVFEGAGQCGRILLQLARSTNYNIWQDYGRSDDDQRHRFVFDGTVHPPLGRKPPDLAADSAMAFR